MYRCEIVGGVVIGHDLVAKLKTAKIFPGMFEGDSGKFVLAKISRYTVCLSTLYMQKWLIGKRLR